MFKHSIYRYSKHEHKGEIGSSSWERISVFFLLPIKLFWRQGYYLQFQQEYDPVLM